MLQPFSFLQIILSKMNHISPELPQIDFSI